MLETIRNAWKIPELRKKLLFVIGCIVVYRFGYTIFVPYVDTAMLTEVFRAQADTLIGYFNVLSGGGFSEASIFALSVYPYINASIIMQLLQIAIPALERMVKDGGEEGRKKIASITRYVTVLLGIITGFSYYMLLRANQVLTRTDAWSAIVIVLTFTAGSAFIMWLGEQINQKGIGNGISILLFAGIVARLPYTGEQLWSYISMANSDSSLAKYYVLAPLWIVLFLAVIWVIVFMNEAERRIPIQYAKRVVGRKMYGGQSSHMPIKVGMSGVMPVIFASSILSIPSTIQLFMGSTVSEGFWKGFFDAFSSTGWLYSILYFILILMFAYFYMTIQYNPIEMANNLRQNNGTIPGIRPGKPTADFIAKILSKVTLIGALFLAFIAIVPIVYGNVTGLGRLSMGGTSVIIMVGVALETVKQMESQMMMRHYKGFLD